MGTRAHGLWGRKSIHGVACPQGPYHHWPPHNKPGHLLLPGPRYPLTSQQLSVEAPTLTKCSGLEVWGLSHPLPCSNRPTSILQSFLLLWGLVQQPSQLCLKRGKWDPRPLESHLFTLNWCNYWHTTFSFQCTLQWLNIYTHYETIPTMSLPSVTIHITLLTLSPLLYMTPPWLIYNWKFKSLNPLHLLYPLKFIDWKTQFKCSMYATNKAFLEATHRARSVTTGPGPLVEDMHDLGFSNMQLQESFW